MSRIDLSSNVSNVVDFLNNAYGGFDVLRSTELGEVYGREMDVIMENLVNMIDWTEQNLDKGLNGKFR